MAVFRATATFFSRGGYGVDCRFCFSTLSFLDGALFFLVPGGGWWFDARASMYGLCARRGAGAGESVFV